MPARMAKKANPQTQGLQQRPYSSDGEGSELDVHLTFIRQLPRKNLAGRKGHASAKGKREDATMVCRNLDPWSK
jgi:hypothetical protein